jgi:hypothetical protein
MVTLKVALIEFTVAEQDLHLSVNDLEILKSRLNNFVGLSQQNTVALRLTVTPLTFVKSSCDTENTHTCARAFTVLELTFVNVSIRVDQLTLAILGALLDLTFIHLVGYSRQLICDLVLNGMPMTGYSVHEHRGHSELLLSLLWYKSELIVTVVMVNNLCDPQFVWTFVFILEYLSSRDQIDAKVLLRRHRM